MPYGQIGDDDILIQMALIDLKELIGFLGNVGHFDKIISMFW